MLKINSNASKGSLHESFGKSENSVLPNILNYLKENIIFVLIILKQPYSSHEIIFKIQMKPLNAMNALNNAGEFDSEELFL